MRGFFNIYKSTNLQQIYEYRTYAFMRKYPLCHSGSRLAIRNPGLEALTKFSGLKALLPLNPGFRLSVSMIRDSGRNDKVNLLVKRTSLGINKIYIFVNSSLICGRPNNYAS
jgi:hypothetical protein